MLEKAEVHHGQLCRQTQKQIMHGMMLRTEKMLSVLMRRSALFQVWLLGLSCSLHAEGKELSDALLSFAPDLLSCFQLSLPGSVPLQIRHDLDMGCIISCKQLPPWGQIFWMGRWS